jgi:hypothetical protein
MRLLAPAVRGKFLLGGLENANPHAFGVTLPLQNSLCLGQNRKNPSLDDIRGNIAKNTNAVDRL